MSNDLSLHFMETLAADLRRAQAATRQPPRPRRRGVRTIAAAILCVLSLSLVSGV